MEKREQDMVDRDYGIFIEKPRIPCGCRGDCNERPSDSSSQESSGELGSSNVSGRELLGSAPGRFGYSLPERRGCCPSPWTKVVNFYHILLLQKVPPVCCMCLRRKEESSAEKARRSEEA